MENNMLQSRQKPRTYKHFTFTPQPETAENQRLEFLYIGKKPSNIDFLINAFDSGYAAESLPNAAGILNRILKQHGKCRTLFLLKVASLKNNYWTFLRLWVRVRFLIQSPFFWIPLAGHAPNWYPQGVFRSSMTSLT